MSTLTSTTSTTRPTLGASDVGKSYFETDSNRIIVWDGTAWHLWNHDQIITPGLASNNFSLSVDGVDDHISCGNITDLVGATAFSLAFWWKPSVSGESPSIGARSNVSNIYAMYKSNFIITTSGTSKILSFTEPAGTDWRYYVVTYSAGAVVIQINGTTVLTNSSYPTSLTTSTSAIFQLGQYTTLTGSSFNSEGLIDDVALWSSALSASGATTIYNSGNPFDITADSGNYNQSSDLIAYWKMGDTSGDSVIGGGNPSDGSSINLIQNSVNPGTYDGTGTNGATYASKVADSNNVPY